MSNVLTDVKQQLLEPGGLTETDLQRVLNNVLSHSIDYADLYFQTIHTEYWGLEEGIVKHASYSIDRGVGVRTLSAAKKGLAYADDIELSALMQAADAARSIASHGGSQRVETFTPAKTLHLYPPINPLKTLTEDEKVALLQQVDREARQQDARIIQVMASITGVHEVILIVTSDGILAADIRPLVSMTVNVIAEENGKRESGSCGGGSRCGYNYFIMQDRAAYYTCEAVRQALMCLEADEMPAGIMPVVLGHGWPGVLLHEAVGHGLEGDYARKGTSVYAGRVGESVASKHCTVVDDGTIKDRRGSMNIDDEGMPTQQTVLIENGILRGYMQDKFNARLMGTQSTGNARRESYSHLPYPRMTNTYLMPGKYAPEEVIASVDKGLYAVNFSGGQVDITSGKFVFTTSEAYLIEKGKVTRPVKDATLIGDGPEILNKVSMVANDLQLDMGVGVCGKEGQAVPVGVGQPTLRIDAMTVGGVK
jgi:TldD protein